MTKFSDIGKAPADLLNDDFTSKVSLKVKKNAGPVAVTLESERGSGGAIDAKVATKFAYAGLSFDKVQFKPDGTYVLETSMTPLDGSKVSFKGSKGADLCLDYKTGRFVTNTVIDVKDMAKFSTAATANLAPGIFVGGNMTYATGDKAGFSAFNIGANYSKGPLFTHITSTNKVSSFNLGIKYDVNPTVSIASSTTHSVAKPLDTFSVGGLYKASFGTVKAKVGCDGVVSACLIKEIVPKVTLTASGSAPAKDPSAFKYGFGIVM